VESKASGRLSSNCSSPHRFLLEFLVTKYNLSFQSEEFAESVAITEENKFSRISSKFAN